MNIDHIGKTYFFPFGYYILMGFPLFQIFHNLFLFHQYQNLFPLFQIVHQYPYLFQVVYILLLVLKNYLPQQSVIYLMDMIKRRENHNHLIFQHQFGQFVLVILLLQHQQILVIFYFLRRYFLILILIYQLVQTRVHLNLKYKYLHQSLYLKSPY